MLQELKSSWGPGTSLIVSGLRPWEFDKQDKIRQNLAEFVGSKFEIPFHEVDKWQAHWGEWVW